MRALFVLAVLVVWACCDTCPIYEQDSRKTFRGLTDRSLVFMDMIDEWLPPPGPIEPFNATIDMEKDTFKDLVKRNRILQVPLSHSQ